MKNGCGRDRFRKATMKSNFSQSERTTSSVRDSRVFYATNAYRLKSNRLNVSVSAIAMQERDGKIFVCTKTGDEMSWAPYQRVMTDVQLREWIATGGFPKMTAGARK